MEKVKTGRKYVIDGLGPASKSFERRQVRSAAVQALRNFLDDNWNSVEPEGRSMQIVVTVRVTGVDSGGRMVSVEAEGNDIWTGK